MLGKSILIFVGLVTNIYHDRWGCCLVPAPDGLSSNLRGRCLLTLHAWPKAMPADNFVKGQMFKEKGLVS